MTGTQDANLFADDWTASWIIFLIECQDPLRNVTCSHVVSSRKLHIKEVSCLMYLFHGRLTLIWPKNYQVAEYSPEEDNLILASQGFQGSISDQPELQEGIIRLQKGCCQVKSYFISMSFRQKCCFSQRKSSKQKRGELPSLTKSSCPPSAAKISLST